MNASQIMFLCLIGLIGMEFGSANIIRRSDTLRSPSCIATLEKPDGKVTPTRYRWQFWKSKIVTWQVMYQSGATGMREVNLFHSEKCSAKFTLDVGRCTIVDCRKSKPATFDTEKHHSQPAPILSVGKSSTKAQGPIEWKNCPVGMRVRADFDQR